MFFEDKINQVTEDKFGIKYKSATLDKETGVCFVELFYKNGIVLSSLDKSNLEKQLTNLLPVGFNYEFKFVKNFVVNEAINEAANKFLKTNYPSVNFIVEKVDCEGDEKQIVISADEKIAFYVEERKIKKALSDFLFSTFNAEINVNFEFKENEKEEPLVFDNYVFDEPVESSSERFIEVSDVVPVVGEFTDTNASYIKDKKVPEENAVICGKIKFLKQNSFEKKSKKSGEEQDEQFNKMDYFKFRLEDFSGSIGCVLFPSQKAFEKAAELKNDDSVIVSGSIRENKFNGKLDMKVKALSLCKIPEIKEEPIKFKECPEAYHNIFPEEVQYYAQADLFAEEKPINQFFLDNDVVVFDFETTGTRVDGSDKIVEIGAVKVHKGKIVESFSCLINPEMPIPKDATKVHGITNEDVKGKPTYQEVMGDFYKFTRGCYLSGYNINGFDMLYLTNFGKKCCYNFDNPVIDVYKLAQKGVRGVKNYKLGTVAEKLGVALDNAHRAVYDTIATAEVLFKLAETMDLLEN